jgi:hypothetical protein
MLIKHHHSQQNVKKSLLVCLEHLRISENHLRHEPRSFGAGHHSKVTLHLLLDEECLTEPCQTTVERTMEREMMQLGVCSLQALKLGCKLNRLILPIFGHAQQSFS